MGEPLHLYLFTDRLLWTNTENAVYGHCPLTEVGLGDGQSTATKPSRDCKLTSQYLQLRVNVGNLYGLSDDVQHSKSPGTAGRFLSIVHVSHKTMLRSRSGQTLIFAGDMKEMQAWSSDLHKAIEA